MAKRRSDIQRLTDAQALAKRPESDVLASVLDLLSRLGIWHVRLNVGGIYNAKGQYVRFGEPGTADVLATPTIWITLYSGPMGTRNQPVPWPTWIETKGSNGKQTREQRIFQTKVESVGHHYIVVKSAAELFGILAQCHGHLSS